MATTAESIWNEHRREIAEILEATNYDHEDRAAQLRIASALAQFVTRARKRRGATGVCDCPMYKVARVVKRAKSQEEFVAMTKKELPYNWSTVLSTYHLDWRIPWDIGFANNRRGRRAPKEELADVQQKIEEVQKTLKELEGDVAVLAEYVDNPAEAREEEQPPGTDDG